MIRGIVFDLFDTLVDQDPTRLAAVRVEGRRVSPSTPHLQRYLEDRFAGERGESIGKEQGASPDREAWRSLVAFSDLQREVDRGLFAKTLAQGIELPTPERFDALLDRLGFPASPLRTELALGLTSTHMAVLLSSVEIPASHEAVLAALAPDHRLAICSNFSHAPTARGLLAKAGFTPHLHSLLFSDEVGFRKPRREIFRAALDALELQPEEILFVGDSLEADIAGAAAEGMATVWVTRQIRDPDAALRQYQGPRPDFALEDLVDLPVLAARLGV